MDILVTGATGYVGAHSAAALQEAGHRLRLLVRDADKALRVTRAVGIEGAEIMVGDVTDASSVRTAVSGCNGVLHAAAVVALDRRRAAEALAANDAGARNVLDAAANAGVCSIVHVSSTSALAALPGELLRSSSPLADGVGYAASKAAAERTARRLQDLGAPIRITYPAGVIGPAAGESLGETSTAMARFVAAGVLPTARAANSLVDVRDVANIHRHLLEAAQPPTRVVCGGTYLPLPILGKQLHELTGRRFPALPIPPSGLRLIGRMTDLVGHLVRADLPVTAESMTLITTWRGTADDEVAALGIEYRPIRETLADALRAWRVAGLLTPRQTGLLDEPAT